jgi:uncharacterized protein (TIGR00725 family)
MRKVSSVVVGVIGAGECDAKTAEQAREIGEMIARAGAELVCGGLLGVMEAACRGAEDAGGLTVGILPGSDRRQANPHVNVPIATGLGDARNYVIINTSDVLIAVGGGHGTLSEIGFALKSGKKVIGLNTWQIDGVIRADSPAQAAELALRAANDNS